NGRRPPIDRSQTFAGRERTMEIIWFIVVGLVAGWLAGLIMKGGGFGVIGDIVVGILGALIGGFLFSSLGASMGGGLLGSIIVAVVGAVILIFILRLIKRAYRPSGSRCRSARRCFAASRRPCSQPRRTRQANRHAQRPPPGAIPRRSSGSPSPPTSRGSIQPERRKPTRRASKRRSSIRCTGGIISSGRTSS